MMSAIESLFRHPAAQALAWALLQFVWQGAAIGALTALGLAALRRSAPDIRYVVSSVGMALMLTLPIVTGVQRYASLRGSATASPSAMPPATAMESGRNPTSGRPSSRASVAGASTGVAGGPGAWNPGPALMLVWLAGVTLLTLRLFGGWFWMQRMRTHGVRPADPAWERVLARLARQLHITRTVTLVESARVDVPTVIGWLAPVVLLPVSAIAQLSPAQLEAIVAHELAHIRRHDYLVNMVQTLVETLLFYHPAVWWVSRRIRIEREHCCDDLAVSLCGDPVAYANALADLEALRSSLPAFRRLDRTAMAATGGSLLLRVRRLLGAPESHAGRGPAWLAASAAVVLVAGIGVGASATGPDRSQARPQPPAPAVAPVLPAAAAAAIASAPAADAAEPATAPMPAASAAPAIASTPAVAAAAAIVSAPAAAAEPTTALAPAAAAAPAVAPAPAASATARPATAGSALPAASPAPALAAAPAAPRAQSISQHGDDAHSSWSWSNGSDRLQVDYHGTIDFTDDDADVRQMSSGGSMKVSDGAWLGRHSVEIVERGGRLEHHYYVNGAERPYEPEGHAWLQQNLPRFVRNTGITAPSRVARFLKSGGVPAVLAEIERIDGNYVRGVYYRELFTQASLTPEQYRQTLKQVSVEMKGSDYELAQMLIALADRLPQDEGARAEYFAAASNVSSPYEARRVYTAMLKKGPVSPPVLGGILSHTRDLTSDYDKAELLLEVLSHQRIDQGNATAFFATVTSLKSDYDRSRVLGAVLKQNSLEADGLREPFFRAADMQSSYERGRILQAVVARSDVGHDTLKLTIQATRSMGNYEAAQLLVAIARKQPVTGDLRDAYIDAAGRLGDYEQGQVMTALVRNERRK